MPWQELVFANAGDKTCIFLGIGSLLGIDLDCKTVLTATVNALVLNKRGYVVY